jgi:hypothetical protein
MKCPQCGGELKYPDYAWSNMYQYRKACTVRTECCGKGVRLIPRMEVEVLKAIGAKGDDWGNAINE